MAKFNVNVNSRYSVLCDSFQIEATSKLEAMAIVREMYNDFQMWTYDPIITIEPVETDE